ncbi:MAG: ATP-binding cassette domain-containing protein [Gammaproteobacteria bacterium]|nr:ATP-binding cassette domain-containing protein [Gammaproteobacteria bacterium]
MIRADDLRKCYAEVTALDGLSFAAQDGHITGLLGPNGAGKTTALRCIYGLVRPDAGNVQVDGLEVARRALDVRRHIGIYPDNCGLYTRLSTREHLAYFGELHGLRGTALATALQATIDRLGMQDIADRRVQGFSQGQRMKVGLGRALLHDPQNLILDEPTRGLDVMSTRALRDLLRQLRAEGRCILFSSHVMQEVAALCDRVVIMARGRLAAQGSPQQLCEQAGETQLEEAFVKLIGSDEGIAA